MKAISLWQPWASAIALELKHFETRSWRPPVGLIGQPLAIHAAKTKDESGIVRFVQKETGYDAAAQLAQRNWPHSRASRYIRVARQKFYTQPFGAVVCIVKIVRVWTTDAAAERITAAEISWGDYTAGRYAWELQMIYKCSEPIPFIGRQGIFDFTIPDDWMEAETKRVHAPWLNEIWKAAKLA